MKNDQKTVNRKTTAINAAIYKALKQIAVQKEVSVQSLIEAAIVKEYKITIS